MSTTTAPSSPTRAPDDASLTARLRSYLVSEGPPSGDPDFARRQVRVTLPPRGEQASSAFLTLDYLDIAEAHVSGVERM